MNDEPAVSILLVNWNGYFDTVSCVESLQTICYSNFKIIIVDNGSSDESEMKLRKRFPRITVLQTGANKGFAGAVNFGIRRAFKKEDAYLLLLNNDTIVDPNFLAELVKRSESDKEIGIAGGKIFFNEPRNRIWAYGGYFDVNNGTARHFENEAEASQKIDPPKYCYIPGCLMLIRRECLEGIGFLTEDYFHLAEDVEYCIRAQRNGWKVALTPYAVIYHKGSSSLSRMSSLYNYYEQRNRLHLIRKYRMKASSFRKIWDVISIFLRLGRALLLTQPTKFFGNLKHIILAVSDYRRGVKGKRF